jgi:Rod binding domain-containing protein
VTIPMDLPSLTGASSDAQQSSVSQVKSPVSSDADQQKLKKAAGDFESLLLSNLWKSMKHSFDDQSTDSDSDPAHGTLDDWGIEIMSGAVGKAGGLGLGKLILEHLGAKNGLKSEEKA